MQLNEENSTYNIEVLTSYLTMFGRIMQPFSDYLESTVLEGIILEGIVLKGIVLEITVLKSNILGGIVLKSTV